MFGFVYIFLYLVSQKNIFAIRASVVSKHCARQVLLLWDSTERRWAYQTRNHSVR